MHYNVRLLISEYQGKCHAGWRLPPGTPSEVEKGMRLLLDAQINEIRGSVLQRKRSDSFPEDRSLFLQKEDEVFDAERGVNKMTDY